MKAAKIVPWVFAFVAVAALVFAVRAPAQGLSLAYDGKPEIVAATFASEWCPACKVLEPNLAEVIPGFAGEPVTFIVFDFTFGERKEVAELADANGVGEIYARNKGATGFTLLIDADTGEIIDTLTMNFSQKAMRAAIARAISIASHTDNTPPAPAI
ncbi:MAG: hypothetical protein R3C40_06420 [Parvularculaceae bacterium]